MIFKRSLLFAKPVLFKYNKHNKKISEANNNRGTGKKNNDGSRMNRKYGKDGKIQAATRRVIA